MQRAHAEFRTFTDTQGRPLTAEVFQYEPVEQIVSIRLEDGRTFDLPLSRFSEEDRKYIKNWAKNPGWVITDETDLAIEVKMSRKRGTKGSGTDFDDRTQSIQPSISIDNREIYKSFEGAKAVLVVLGEDMSNAKRWKVLSREEFTFSVPKRSATSFKGKMLVNEYDDSGSLQYGFKYDGYVFYILNKDNVIVHVKASYGIWERNTHRFSKLAKDMYVDRKLNEILLEY
ncbi:MAG: hypothetical protein ACFBZ8_13715 [Opitutales bacterium]